MQTASFRWRNQRLAREIQGRLVDVPALNHLFQLMIIVYCDGCLFTDYASATSTTCDRLRIDSDMDDKVLNVSLLQGTNPMFADMYDHSARSELNMGIARIP